MRKRDRMALNLTPLCLRLPLALIFIWAGLSKIATTTPVNDYEAAVLQSHSVSVPGAPPPPADPAPETPAAEPPADPNEAETPDTDDPVESAPAESEPPSDTPSEPLPDPETDTDDPDADSTDEQPRRSVNADHTPRIILAQDAAATDEASSPEVRSVYKLVILMDQAADPGTRDAKPIPAIWPKALASNRVPVFLAWAAAITELFAGFFLLIGLVTRLSAVALSGVMLTAIWLTTIGGAIQSGSAFLGFLPNEPFLSFSWKEPFWQLLVLMACLALFFAGPGALALDRAIFASSRDDDLDDDDDDRDRSAFDRAP